MWQLMTWLAILTAVQATHYVLGDPRHFDPIFRDRYTALLPVVILHGVAGSLALLIGPYQFWTDLRRRHPPLHRWAGRVYLACVGLASLTAFPLAWGAWGGGLAQSGFLTMDVLWLGTAWQALGTIRRGDVAAHQLWLRRNYALTFGAVTLRLYLHGLQLLGFGFSVYPWLAWASWGGNLIAVEMGRNK